MAKRAFSNYNQENACLPAGPPVHHFDLYRLSGQSVLGRLEMDTALSSGVCLIEWPERLGDKAPAERLAIHISMLSEV